MKDKFGNNIFHNNMVEITFISGRKQYERVREINGILVVEENSLLSNFNQSSLRKLSEKEELKIRNQRIIK